jgi:hypothetical protein
MRDSTGSAGHLHMTASPQWAEMRDYVGQQRCVTQSVVGGVARAACIPTRTVAALHGSTPELLEPLLPAPARHSPLCSPAAPPSPYIPHRRPRGEYLRPTLCRGEGPAANPWWRTSRGADKPRGSGRLPAAAASSSTVTTRPGKYRTIAQDQSTLVIKQ